jgi:hypothetical protein
VGALLLALAELGFHVGYRLHLTRDEPRKTLIGGVHGAVLGMLALLLGFTFSMALSRYEHRRELVLSEANSIGTTYLRSSLLPAAYQAPVQSLLRRYVDARLAWHEAGSDAQKQAEAQNESTQLQRELWGYASASAKETPTPITATFILTLNETIDLDASRLEAQRSRVPGAVWLLVLLVAGTGCYACGYGPGASGVRASISNIVVPLLITVVISLISDLDRPHHGLVLMSAQPLIDVKASIANSPPVAPVPR